ncbi:MAG: lipid II flippase MurJ [Patescibacteria group bacterium]
MTLASLNAAALILGAANLLSRILGMFRNRLLAGHFGASRDLDIYLAAFQIPDFLFVVFLIGAASAAIIPVFLEQKENDGVSARLFIYRLLIVFSAVALVLSVGVAVLAPVFIPFVTPGFTPAERTTVVTLARIMMVSPVFLGLSGIIAAVMQAEGKFVVFALSPVFYNIGIIAGILLLFPLFRLPGLAAGVVLGAMLHCAIQIPTFLRLGFSPFIALSALKKWRSTLNASVRRVAALSIPRVVALSVSQATFIALIAFASRLDTGSISVFQFAFDLHSLPIGIFGISFAVAAYPALCDAARAADARQFMAILRRSVSAMLFWIIPLAVFTFILRLHIVRLILGAGRFGPDDIRLTAATLSIFASAIVFEPIRVLLIRAFYAVGNTRKPLLISIAGSAATIAGTFLFVPFFANRAGLGTRLAVGFFGITGVTRAEIIGLALSFSVGLLLQTAVMALAFAKEANRRFSANIVFHPNGHAAKIILATIAGGLASISVLRIAALFYPSETFGAILIQGITSFSAGFSIYTGILYLWGDQNARQLISLIRHKKWIATRLPREQNHFHR